MPMKNPPYPGEIIRDLYLEPLKLTVTEVAAGLGVTRKTLSQLVNGHASISPEMAERKPKRYAQHLLLNDGYRPKFRRPIN